MARKGRSGGAARLRLAGRRVLMVLAVSLLLPATSVSRAQPRGPADIISGARQQREQKEMRQAVEAVPEGVTTAAEPVAAPAPAGSAPADAAPEGSKQAGQPPEMPAGHPPTGEMPAGHPPTGEMPAGHPPTGVGSGDSARAAAGGQGRPRPMSEGREDTSLPAGSLHVRVVDTLERPVPEAPIRLGILKSDGSRDSREATADAKGEFMFEDLPAGDRQAYRVSVTAGGARFASTPFRLPHKHGYRSLIRKMPTTDDPEEVVLYVGAASVELKDDRLKVVQQQRLVNIGSRVYVLPEEGLKLRLPEGATAFQTQETMTDQQVEADETHVTLSGSIPPGQTTLMWGFDLPVDGTEMAFTLENPWVTFAYRVLSDAPEGMTLAVDDLPPAQLHEDGSKRYWVTETARHPNKDALKAITIRVSGIPGPGPLRWVSAALAVVMLIVGFSFARRPPAHEAEHDPAELAERKAALLEEARALDRERAEEAIGPEYYAEERGRLVDELAVVLWQLDRAQGRERAKNAARTEESRA